MNTPVTRAKAYLKVRHKAVRDAMKTLNLDALLLTSPADLGLSDEFHGGRFGRNHHLKRLLTGVDFRYKEQAELEAGWLKAVMREGKMSDALADTLLETKAKRGGV